MPSIKFANCVIFRRKKLIFKCDYINILRLKPVKRAQRGKILYIKIPTVDDDIMTSLTKYFEIKPILKYDPNYYLLNTLGRLWHKNVWFGVYKLHNLAHKSV